VSAKILIVEDHDVLRRTLNGWLQTMFPGCHVIEATCGEDAITIAQDNLPQIAIMDIGLPGISGLEATKRIKLIAPGIQVVILTKYEDEAYRSHATANGANAYVWKDVMLTELLPTLTALL
jgi:DNA-binding NarL/FixJ family response regulator